MNVYGPRQDYHGAYIAVIMKMLDAIDRGKGPTVLGDGSEAFDFSLRSRTAPRLTFAQCVPPPRTASITSGPASAPRSRNSPACSCELTGSNQKPVNYAPRSQATLVRNRIGCPKRASAEVNFTAAIGLDEGLRRLIDWRRNHRAEVEARRRSVGLTD